MRFMHMTWVSLRPESLPLQTPMFTDTNFSPRVTNKDRNKAPTHTLHLLAVTLSVLPRSLWCRTPDISLESRCQKAEKCGVKTGAIPVSLSGGNVAVGDELFTA
jgi:hypothetical protein